MSFCKVVAVGRLGHDPEIRFTATGTAIANFSIAVDDGYGDKKRTDWHRCTAFGKTAETIGEHVKKGALIGVDGKLTNREWQDKDGNKRTTTEVVVDRFYFVGPKQQQDQGYSANTSGHTGNADAGGASYGSWDDVQNAARGGAPVDDDIPFARRDF